MSTIYTVLFYTCLTITLPTIWLGIQLAVEFKDRVVEKGGLFTLLFSDDKTVVRETEFGPVTQGSDDFCYALKPLMGLIACILTVFFIIKFTAYYYVFMM